MKISRLFPIACALSLPMLLQGCDIESVDSYNASCPPMNNPEQLSLGYIITHDGLFTKSDGSYDVNFETQHCPDEAPICMMNKRKDAYYCSVLCTDSEAITCFGDCVIPKHDPNFCGAKGACTSDDPDDANFKGEVCAANQMCKNGKCEWVCEPSEILCDGQCVNPMENSDFCGAKGACSSRDKNSANFIGEICTSKQACVNGKCETTCNTPNIICNDECIDPMKNDGFCGAKGTCTDNNPESDDYKGVVCAAGTACRNGQCDKVCDAPNILCGDTCVDPTKSHDFCGAKGACSSDDPGSDDYKGVGCAADETCRNGVCKTNCTDSEILCNDTCITPLTNKKYCGAKGSCSSSDENSDDYRGTSCNNLEICVNGQCVASAPTCFNDTTIEYYDQDGTLKKEFCEDNTICYDGSCVNTRGTCSADTDCKTTTDFCHHGKCISQLQCNSATFEPYCSKDGRKRYVCVSGELQTQSCNFDETCASETATCEKRHGQPCDDTFKAQCHALENNTSAYERCGANHTIEIQTCSGNNFCGIYNGNADCRETCKNVGMANCTTTGPVFYVKQCKEMTDAFGSVQAGYVLSAADCAVIGGAQTNLSRFCITDGNYVDLESLNCERFGTTCDPKTGFCKDVSPCTELSASCQNNVNRRCLANPLAPDTYVQLEERCKECGERVEADGSTVEDCYYSGTLEDSGKEVSNFGTCDGKVLLKIDGVRYVQEVTCAYGCVSGTSATGHPYAYCANR